MALLVVLCVLCTLLCASTVTACGSSDTCQVARNELVESACYVQGNSTLLSDYYRGVRAKHHHYGNNYDQYYSNINYAIPKTLRCRRQCAGTTQDDVTWCVNVWNYNNEVQLCLNSSGFTNMSTMAEDARIHEHFRMPKVIASCLDADAGINYRTGCLEVKRPQYYLNGAYLTCTTQTETCTRTSFYQIEVTVNGYDNEPPALMNSWPENGRYQLTLGQTAILECTVILTGLSWFAGWYQNDILFEPVAISPRCNPTIQNCIPHDHPKFKTLLMERKYVLQSTGVFRSCPLEEVVISTFLKITNVTESDTGVYMCTAESTTVVPSPHDEISRWNITAVTVPPEREINLQEFPQSSLYTVPFGANVNWTVILTAGSYDSVFWQFNDVPVVVLDSLHECTNTSHSVFAFVTEEYVLNYTSQYVASLHICGALDGHTGLYSLLVSSRTVQKHVVGFQVDVLPKGTAENATKQDDSTYVLYIFVPVAILIVCIVSVLVILVLLKLRNQKKPGDLSSVFVPEEHGISEDNLKNETTEKLSSMDPMEFPRAKLHLMSTVLGEGAFGKVLQAKAKGIVEGAPKRNVVAVKTTKDAPTLQETRELWDELLLMKRIDPHENILNLLGHCTTVGGPLYLIIEYAMYGSLKDFLRQCEEVVQSLNHIPIIVSSNARTRTTSCSSCSSAYPLMAYEKTPLSAQNSVFSAGTPVGHKKFVFPPSQRQRLQTQDSGCFSDLEDSSSAAYVPGLSSMAHTVCPLTHDYVNAKGLIYMDDVQNFALQIACGLQHLENMQVVHCDLAARNILIAEGFVLKIADFGMAREVGEKAYYRKSPKGRIPVKWTAPEALKSHLFTYQSDVWSFGVVLWEIFAYGRVPYHEINIRSMEPFITYLEEGNRLSMPDGCPEEFYDIMQRCWELNPEQRPTASDLVTIFNPEAGNPSAGDVCGSTLLLDADMNGSTTELDKDMAV